MARRPKLIVCLASGVLLLLITSNILATSATKGRSQQSSTIELETGPFFLEHRCIGDGCPSLMIELRDEAGTVVDSGTGQPTASIQGIIPASGTYTLSVSYDGEAPLVEIDASWPIGAGAEDVDRNGTIANASGQAELTFITPANSNNNLGTDWNGSLDGEDQADWWNIDPHPGHLHEVVANFMGTAGRLEGTVLNAQGIQIETWSSESEQGRSILQFRAPLDSDRVLIGVETDDPRATYYAVEHRIWNESAESPNGERTGLECTADRQTDCVATLQEMFQLTPGTLPRLESVWYSEISLTELPIQQLSTLLDPFDSAGDGFYFEVESREVIRMTTSTEVQADLFEIRLRDDTSQPEWAEVGPDLLSTEVYEHRTHENARGLLIILSAAEITVTEFQVRSESVGDAGMERGDGPDRPSFGIFDATQGLTPISWNTTVEGELEAGIGDRTDVVYLTFDTADQGLILGVDIVVGHRAIISLYTLGGELIDRGTIETDPITLEDQVDYDVAYLVIELTELNISEDVSWTAIVALTDPNAVDSADTGIYGIVFHVIIAIILILPSIIVLLTLRSHSPEDELEELEERINSLMQILSVPPSDPDFHVSLEAALDNLSTATWAEIQPDGATSIASHSSDVLDLYAFSLNREDEKEHWVVGILPKVAWARAGCRLHAPTGQAPIIVAAHPKKLFMEDEVMLGDLSEDSPLWITLTFVAHGHERLDIEVSGEINGASTTVRVPSVPSQASGSNEDESE